LRSLVVDASVAAKWFLPSSREPYADEARQLLAVYGSNRIQFVVPDLFWVEMANVFWKAVRGRYWAINQVRLALGELSEMQFRTVDARRLILPALIIAEKFERALYDSLYVALAIDSGCELLTADERLANATASKLPVKWIGMYTPPSF
jgi:predicted nucleic acid-binding protein